MKMPGGNLLPDSHWLQVDCATPSSVAALLRETHLWLRRARRLAAKTMGSDLWSASRYGCICLQKRGAATATL